MCYAAVPVTAVDVSTHDEPLPAEAEPLGQPVQRLRFSLTLPAEVVFSKVLEQLVLPASMPRFHPFITKVYEQPERLEGTRIIRDFEIDEGVPLFAGLKVPNHYRGRIMLDSKAPDVARLSGWSSPGIRIEARHASPVAGTYVETLWFSAPWLVRAFTRSQLIVAHSRLMQALISAARSQP